MEALFPEMTSRQRTLLRRSRLPTYRLPVVGDREFFLKRSDQRRVSKPAIGPRPCNAVLQIEHRPHATLVERPLSRMCLDNVEVEGV